MRAEAADLLLTAYRTLADTTVELGEGTGVVHIAPAFGEDDYAVASENGIFDPTEHGTLYNPVGLDGHFDKRVVGFEGQFVKDPEVTAALINDLRERGLLFHEQVYEHAYPHCWRCGTPLLYYAKSSWYVATSREREGLLANNAQIGWHPEHIRHGRFGDWRRSPVVLNDYLRIDDLDRARSRRRSARLPPREPPIPLRAAGARGDAPVHGDGRLGVEPHRVLPADGPGLGRRPPPAARGPRRDARGFRRGPRPAPEEKRRDHDRRRLPLDLRGRVAGPAQVPVSCHGLPVQRFRRRRAHPHRPPVGTALDALATGIERRKVNWILDADIRDFLDPWSYCSFADCHDQNSWSWGLGSSIRRPFLRPVRTWTARSLPSLTRCMMVWRETP